MNIFAFLMVKFSSVSIYWDACLECVPTTLFRTPRDILSSSVVSSSIMFGSVWVFLSLFFPSTVLRLKNLFCSYRAYP